MTLPYALDPDRTALLQSPPPGPDAQRALAGGALLRRLVAGARRRGTAQVKQRVRPALERFVERQNEPLRASARASALRMAELEDEVSRLHQTTWAHELLKTDTLAATVNLELLKGEVRAVEHTLQELGSAIAPATGIDGAGVRMAELRERLNGLDRRLRTVMGRVEAAGPSTVDAVPSAGSAASPTASPTANPTSSPAPPARESAHSNLFDYVGFERRFRGDPDEVVRILDERYGGLLRAHAPVLDVGCGRAELLSLLRDEGVSALGVDTDPSMVAEAQARGLDVHQVDALSYLRAREPASLGAIIATHVVEHLGLDELIELLELSATRLRPGGVFIAETPNPQSLIVLGNSYLLDPTHVRPLHPSLLAFLCEGAGFRAVELRFFAPATGYHLPMVEDPAAPTWVETVNQGFRQLNEVLFGSQDFAVVATAAPATA